MEMVGVTRTISFKLKLTKYQAKIIDCYAADYKKAVNFALSRIHELRKNWELIEYRKRIEDECPLCKQKTKLIWRFKGDNRQICGKCYNATLGDSSIRKLLYPTRKRPRVDHRNNIKNVAPRISGSDFPQAIKQATDTYKSLRALQKRQRQQLYRERDYVKHLRDVIEDNELVIELDTKVDNITYKKGQKISAREVIPAVGRQRNERWIHRLRLGVRNPATEKVLRKRLTRAERMIRKLEKAIGTLPKFKRGSIIKLHENSVKLSKLAENKVKILGEEIQVYATNTKKQKSRDWFKQAVDEIIKQGKTRYPTLVIKEKKKRKEYYLQYPLTTTHSIAMPDASFKALGIDRGVNHVAVYVIVNHLHGKPHNINFASGKELLRKKRKYDLIRKKFTGTKNRLKSFAPFKGKSSRISERLIHDLSHQIVELAKSQAPITIVMEELTGIRARTGRGNYSKKTERKMNYLLSNFVFSKLQTAIEYKAHMAGIPVTYISPENTSRKCSHPLCEHVDPKSRGVNGNISLFKCTKCGREINADLNAAINIANRFYEYLGDKERTPVFKGGCLKFNKSKSESEAKLSVAGFHAP